MSAVAAWVSGCTPRRAMDASWLTASRACANERESAPLKCARSCPLPQLLWTKGSAGRVRVRGLGRGACGALLQSRAPVLGLAFVHGCGLR